MQPARLLTALLGEFAWSPPDWLRRLGVRRAGWSLFGLLGIGILTALGFSYWRSLPQPLRVGVAITAPGVTAIVDGELKPEPLLLDFHYLANPDVPELPVLSAARLDLVKETLEAGIDLDPAAPGEWRFETENQLVFEPAEDWPADRSYRVRLAPDLFAPGVRLAAASVEFTTPPFKAWLEEGLFVQHPVEVSDRRVVASLRFSHPVGRGDLERRLSMSIGEDDDGARRALPYRVEYGPHDRTAHVHSDVFAIPERDQFVTVSVAADLAPAVGGGAFEETLAVQVRIPNQESYFRVQRMATSIVRDTEGNPVQTAVVTLTDQVSTDDFAERIMAWVLPEELTIGGNRDGPYHWRSASEVTAAVLSAAEPLEVTVNPTERDTSALQSLAFDAPEGRYVYLRVASGLTSAGGFVLASASNSVAAVPAYPKEAAIAQDGALLPLTGKRRVTLSARGVATVRVEVQQILRDALSHLVSQTGGDIRNPWFRDYRFDADNISSLTTHLIDVNPGHPGEQVFATLDLDPFLDRGGLFIVRVQGWDREREQAVGSFDRRMALVTDLGVLAKTNADGSQHAFVHSVATGRPIAGARVEVLGKNGLPVLSAATDGRGHARLDSAADFKRDRAPAVIVVKHGGDTTFVPYRRRDRQLTWSGFDVGGERVGADAAEELKAALYTDRGLYRPGETVRLFGIVRRGDIAAVPGMPVELRIEDARRRLALRTRSTLPADGLLTWSFDTRLESPTGRYRANVYLIDEEGRYVRALGGASFSVEDYRPDRLRIRAAVEGSPEHGWVRPGDHVARVSLQNLFGTPAQGRRVRGTLTLHPVSPEFDAFPEFTFTDPYRDPDTLPRPVTIELAETVTGDDGVARLPLDLGRYENGIYRLRLEAEGFEAGGGRGVVAVAGTLLSPAETLVGYRADGDLAFISRAAERTVRFVAVGPDASARPVTGLETVLLERRYVSALVKQQNGALAYQSVLKETEVRREPFALPEEGAEIVLPSSQPGRYALEVVGGGVKLSRVEFAVAGAANLAGNLERDAELDLKLDRAEYRPGEEIVMEISAPYAGAGLVTIERERLYAFQWFRSETNTTLARIRVPEDLEGNAYVNVALVRDIDSEEIFASPLSYAVAPFTIDRSDRRLEIDLVAPDLVRPGDELTLSVATPSSSRLVLFAVDEGILQVAGYQTPDPLETFLAKKALQVETHQMVDLILPDYDVIRRAAAPGGGEAARRLGANLNPFRRRSEPPAAYWMDIVEAGPQPRAVQIRLPDYWNGELRVMAVGVSDDRLGSLAKPVTVRGPIVVTPNLPLAVAPGDAFEVSVGVANHLEGSGPEAEIVLTAAPSERLAVEDGSSRTVAVAEGDEGRAAFRLRAGDSPGTASLTLTARLDQETVQRGAEVSVRPATAFVTTVSSGFDARGRARVDVPRRLHEAQARRQVAASASPLVLVDGLLDYLRTFPHGCVEQMVSGIFPRVGLLQSSDFPLDRGALLAEFRETVTRLRSRQGADGGFRFWAASAEAAAFPSVYVTHFLTDARAFGMAVPDDVLGSALGYLRRLAETPPPASGGTLKDARTRAYATYLLTRSGVVTTNYLSSLQETLDTHFEDAWRGDIASAYMAASYGLLRSEVLAERLIGGYRLGASPSPDTDFDTRLGRDAQYVYLLARHFPERMAELDGDAVRSLVEPVFENRFNTLSAAYTILALGEVHRSLARRDLLRPPTISASGEDGPVGVEVTGNVYARASLPVAVDAVDIAGADGSGVYYSLSESGFDVEVPTGPLSRGFEIDRVYLNAEGEPVDRVRVGEELEVRLRVRSQGGRITNVAVTDLLPGGFEILTESVRNRYGLWAPDYSDVREDRLVFYGSFGERFTEIRYRVKATSPGEFVAPAAYAASMYDRNRVGRTAAGRLIVGGE